MTEYKSTFNPINHINGKTYDLTQGNMNAMLNEIDRLNKKIDELHTDSLEDYREYKKFTTQLIKDLRDQNDRYKKTLEHILMPDERLEGCCLNAIKCNNLAAHYYEIASEALKKE